MKAICLRAQRWALFAALLVIFGHAFRLTGEVGPAFAGTGVATTGVKIFFVISGYLVAQSWMRDPNPARFLRRGIADERAGEQPVHAGVERLRGPAR